MALETTWEQAVSYSAQIDRINLEAMHFYAGILGAASFKVTPNGSMQIAVAIGRAIVKGSAQTNQGNYVVRNTAVITANHNPAPGSGSRIDRIVLRVYDNAADSSGQNTAAIEIVAGTSGGSPVAPAAPNSTITLALVTIPTGKTSILTGDIADQRQMTGQPTGILMPWVGLTTQPIPNGWLLANGQTVVRATYADLFEICSTRFNTGGEAGTDFRLPNIKGRAIIGMDDMGNGPANAVTAAVADVSGGLGGAESVTLATAEIPAHAHNVTDHSHFGPGGQSFVVQNLASAGQSVGVITAQYTASNNPTTGGMTAGVNTGNAGGGSPHTNMQPYIAFAYLIKY